jgi:hypothetical protein
MEDRKYPKGAIVERGKKLYEERVRPHVDEEAERGTFVAIDVESGDWETGDDELDAAERLEARRPEARGRLYFTRVGLGYTAKIGGRPQKFASSE